MIKTINHHTSINEAILSLHPGDTLILENGTYNEKVEVNIPNIKICAKTRGQVIIRNKDYYHKIMSDHNECNTFRTYTFYVGANYVTLEGLTILNDSVPSQIYGQAVALHVDGSHFICQDCTIQSAQDTLFTGPMPDNLLEKYQGFHPKDHLKGTPSIQYYKDCKILGDVDFIFGGATALFENCEIITIDRGSTTPSYICAPSHKQDLEFGYLFYKCSFVGSETAYLARPWRDYGCAAFILCTMDDHIHPLGYNKWNQTNRDKTARFYEYTLNCDLSQREPWSHQLTEQQAQEYVTAFLAFIDMKK